MNVDIAEPIKRALGELTFANLMLKAQLTAAEAKIEELQKQVALAEAPSPES